MIQWRDEYFTQIQNVRFTPEDIAIIERLQQHSGIASQNEVIRMALRSAERELPTPHTAQKERPFHPHGSSQGSFGPER